VKCRALNADERLALRRYVPTEDLDAARLHDGQVPWYLSRRFIAIVRGNHIFVRAGAYRPGTVEGIALLGHELTHVTQYRLGMTAFSYLLSAVFGYANSCYEREAFAVQARIHAEWGADT